MKLLIALTLTLAFASSAFADEYNYKCQAFGSPDTYQLQISDLMAMITTDFDGSHMGTGNNGSYQFSEPMQIGSSMYMQATLSVPMGEIGASYLDATVGDSSDPTNTTDLDCTLQ